jgi:signal transduction histidine kinase
VSSEARFRPFGQLGLRARIVATFTLGAVAVAALLSLASVTFSRQSLLDQREQLVSERVRVNGATVSDLVSNADVEAQALFGSLSTAGPPSVIVTDLNDPTQRRAISLDPKYGANTIPAALRRRVLTDGDAALMRYELDGEPLLAAGVPIDDGNGGYFEVSRLEDIERSINTLGLTLSGASAAAAFLGALLGYWASRRVLKPLADVSRVAEAVAKGRLDARLAYAEWSEDPDLAQLVSTFNEMVAALQNRIDRDARFASDVSHELRSPLTTFNASLEVLRNAQDEMPERAQVALDLLSSDMERFTQLVEDLLEISRFDAGAVRLELDEVLVTESIRMAVKALSADPVPVVADPTLEGVIMSCDKRRLMRILANFLDNARKYGDGAELVTVERIAAQEPDAETPDIIPLEHVRIAVEDGGTGVPEDQREAIFDRFNRGSLGGSRGRDLGVGLGLALAAEHARLQGGSIWVEDRAPGTPGARFVVELPLIEPDDDDEFALDTAATEETT